MSNPQFDFSGQVALVTGAASGIGETTALQFASAGAAVVLADVSAEAGNNLAQRINNQGGEAVFVQADISSAQDCDAMVQSAIENFKRLDIAFNNAAIMGSMTPTADYQGDEWRKVLEINVGGLFNCLQSEIKAMRDLGTGGAVVNNASIMGLRGGHKVPAYSASKHAVVGLTRSAALDHARDNIRVNAVCPGFVMTPMAQDSLNPRAREALISRTPLARLAEPKEIANVVMWLTSSGAAYITGVAIPVDGGYTAG